MTIIKEELQRENKEQQLCRRDQAVANELERRLDYLQSGKEFRDNIILRGIIASGIIGGIILGNYMEKREHKTITNVESYQLLLK